MSEESEMAKRAVDRKTNPALVSLIQDLKKASYERKAPIWRDIAERLEKPSSKRAELNLSRLDLYAKANETIVVPGKILGAGKITKPVKVAAYAFSSSAMDKITLAGGSVLTIRELIAENPKGTNVRIMV